MGEVVYMIEAAGLDACKIGFSRHLGHRLAAIQTCCPAEIRVLCIRPGDRDSELFLQAMFRSDRLYGEWFRLTDSMRHRCAFSRAVLCNDTWQEFLSLREGDPLLKRFAITDLGDWELAAAMDNSICLGS